MPLSWYVKVLIPSNPVFKEDNVWPGSLLNNVWSYALLPLLEPYPAPSTELLTDSKIFVSAYDLTAEL